MEIDPAHWPLLPVGVLVALAYTSTGISGANFWVPVFLLGLGLDPRLAFWLGLVAMLFGSTSGLVRHARQGTIEPRAAGRLLAVSVPAAVAGSLAAPWAPTPALAAAFGLFALTLGALLLRRTLAGEPVGGRAPAGISPLRTAAGGLLTGLISVGLGAMLLPRMLASRRYEHHATAVGTSLLAVFVTSLAAALARLRGAFLEQLRDALPEVLGILAFVVPAVLVGGQLGPRVARRLDRRAMYVYGSLLLIAIGVVMLARLAVQLRAA